MNPAGVVDCLAKSGIDARFCGRTDSTQDEAFRLARSGAPSGTVVIASEQTSGRGRMGRQWLSPAGGLYASILLRPRLPRDKWSGITLYAGLSVVSTVRAAGLRTAVLKWPNDCLVDGRKLCGILAESLPGEGIVVLGIGMNIRADRALAPEGGLESRLPAVALEQVMRADYERVCVGLLSNLLTTLEAADRGLPLDTAGIGEMLWSHGEVSVCVDGTTRSGHVAGVDSLGMLILLMPDGARLFVSSGEVGYACRD
jgi:BirA family transcriptional regulator, biotin operon repressor / biotin---[acetyl-CoA-carboxylase] ligase